MRRRARVGAVERLISAASVYPFRCQRCRHGFRALSRGRRYGQATGERREDERVPLRLRARLTAGTDSAEAETIELSVSGCAVRTSATFPAGTEVRVTLQLASGRPLEIHEAVVRASHEGRLSVQFIQVGLDEQRRLAEYLAAVALPFDTGRPRHGARLSIELVLVAAAGLVVIFLLLSLLTRAGAPIR